MSKTVGFLLFFGVCAGSGFAATDANRTIEMARYLYEIEGNSTEALRKLQAAESKASPQELQSIHLLRSEILARSGQKSQARDDLRKGLAQGGLNPKMAAQWIKHVGTQPIALASVKQVEKLQTKPDTLLSWNNLVYLMDANGKLWSSPVGVQPRWNPIAQLPKGNLLRVDGQRAYSLDNTRQIITVTSLKNGTTKLVTLQSPARWARSWGDLLVLASGNALEIVKGQDYAYLGHLNNDCQPADYTEGQALILCPASASLVTLDLSQPRPRMSAISKSVQGAMLVPGGLVLRTANGLEKRDPSGRQQWQIQLRGVEHTVFTDGAIFAKLSRELVRIRNRDGRIEARRGVEQGRLLAQQGRPAVFSPSGEISFFDAKLGTEWRYHPGEALAGDPSLSDSTMLLVTRSGTQAILNRNYAGGLHSERDAWLDEARKAASAGSKQKALSLSKKVLALEPGNSEARFLETLLSAQVPNPDDAHQLVLNASRGEDKARALQLLAQSLSAKWAVLLEQDHAAFPRFRQRGSLLYWVHPERGVLRSLRLSDGAQVSAPALQAPPGLAQSFDFTSQGIAGLENGRIQLRTSQRELLRSSTQMTSLWIGSFGDKVVRVGLKGNVEICDNKTLATLEQLPSADPTPLISIEKSANALDLVHRSGTWLRIWPEGSLWQKREIDIGEVDAALSRADALYLSADNQISAINTNGQKMWSQSLPNSAISLQGDQMRLYAGLSDQRIVALDRITGEQLWTYQGAASLFVRPLLWGNSLLIDQGESLVVLDASTGLPRNRIAFPFRIGNIQAAGGSFLITSSTGILLSIDERIVLRENT